MYLPSENSNQGTKGKKETKPKFSRRKEVIKITAEIHKIENRKNNWINQQRVFLKKDQQNW